METPRSLDGITQLGFAFWGSKALLSAIELGVFTLLAKQPLDCESISKRLELHPRSARDFLDALVALKMLERDGSGPAATYRNTPDADYFLDRDKPSYAGGILEMCNARLYKFWGTLTDGLRSGQPQNEITRGGDDFFGTLYSDPARLRQFLAGMTGLSAAAARAIAQKFEWNKYNTFIDVGGAQGAVAVQAALAHRHLTGGSFDLPQVGPIFDEYVRSFGLSARLKFHPGNFFKDALPPADVYVMGHILHDWNLDDKMLLLKKCYDALPAGGALIVHEALIDDERRTNAFGLLMSLNMLIETPGGFDFTGADCARWMKQAGFRETRVEHLAGPDSMVVGVK